MQAWELQMSTGIKNLLTIKIVKFSVWMVHKSKNKRDEKNTQSENAARFERCRFCCSCIQILQFTITGKSNVIGKSFILVRIFLFSFFLVVFNKKKTELNVADVTSNELAVFAIVWSNRLEKMNRCTNRDKMHKIKFTDTSKLLLVFATRRTSTVWLKRIQNFFPIRILTLALLVVAHT